MIFQVFVRMIFDDQIDVDIPTRYRFRHATLIINIVKPNAEPPILIL